MAFESNFVIFLLFVTELFGVTVGGNFPSPPMLTSGKEHILEKNESFNILCQGNRPLNWTVPQPELLNNEKNLKYYRPYLPGWQQKISYIPAPNIVDENKRHTTIGDTIKLTCCSEHETTEVMFEWKTPTGFDPKRMNKIFDESPYETTLTVFNATKNDKGVYTCIVFDHHQHQNTSNITITVLDESYDIADTSQLLIFIPGINKKCEISEDVLSVHPMKDTTTSEDFFIAVEECSVKVKTWNKIVSILLRMVFLNRENAGLLKGTSDEVKELQPEKDILFLHCIVTTVVNFILGRA
uniref:Uncharacterized protein LOC114340515 n=1 Tax=Diabrotica virgifera virgifera TaxID=50390 RepID=A0A6P7GTB8_DIAVI